MTAAAPSVSVIVPVYNGGRFLGEALASALAQDVPPTEVIVVDDGSDDDSASIARATDGVRCVQQAHQGVSVARNRGLAEARGEMIAFLDADDLWTPDKLRVQIAYMREHPELGFSVTYQRILLDPDVTPPRWVTPQDLAGQGPCLGTGAMVVWASVFSRVGLFDPALPATEDTDWIVRALDAGIGLGLVTETLLLRRAHRGSLTFDRPRHGLDLVRILRRSLARKREHPVS